MTFLEELFAFIGRWHPLLVHLPIGMLLLAFAMALSTKFDKTRDYHSAIRFSLSLTSIASIVAAGTGYLLSRDGGYETEILAYHQWLGIGVGVVSCLTFLLYNKTISDKEWLARLQKKRFIFLFIAVVLLGFTGHYGGTLTHGKGYISDALPTAIKERLRIMPAEEEDIRIADVQEAYLYEEIIQPILIQRCQSCHGPRKKESELALHNKESLLKGGEGGPVIVDGQADESELYARLVLPEGHEKRMPPKGRKPISVDHIKLIGWWITEGASFDKKVGEISQSPEIKELLAKLENGGADRAESEYANLPEGKPLPDDLVEQMQGKGLKILPIAVNSTYVSVNAINYPQLNDEDLKQLLLLKDHIVQLKLGYTAISDAGLEIISEMPYLKRLHLERTAITDNGLGSLEGHCALVYINLVGTNVSDKGLRMLAGIPTLKDIYVYQTQVQTSLENDAISEIGIDTGNYTLPFLNSDTIRY